MSLSSLKLSSLVSLSDFCRTLEPVSQLLRKVRQPAFLLVGLFRVFARRRRRTNETRRHGEIISSLRWPRAVLASAFAEVCANFACCFSNGRASAAETGTCRPSLRPARAINTHEPAHWQHIAVHMPRSKLLSGINITRIPRVTYNALTIGIINISRGAKKFGHAYGAFHVKSNGPQFRPYAWSDLVLH